MALKLMYITNRPEIAAIAEQAGADSIFVDLEYIGKQERQGGMDTVQSRHTLEDIAAVSRALTKAELLVRCNPIHEKNEQYLGTEEEIEQIICQGGQRIMLPYFKTPEEAGRFLHCVGGRVKTCLLLETPEAAERIDEILALPGIDEIHIGLNDLSLGYKKKFMFEVLSDGTVEHLCNKIKEKDIFFGFGGIASLGRGALPAEYVIREHYRLGSRMAILSRSFCNANLIQDPGVIRRVFRSGLREIREFERECELLTQEQMLENKLEVETIVNRIVSEMKGT